jgi:molecular chaperone GrpE
MVKEHNYAEWEEKYKRARADYINLERRVENQREEIIKLANAALIQKILPVLDDLERAAAAGEEGVKIIFRNLREALQGAGVEELVVAVGDEFDPETMECLDAGGVGDDARVAKVLRKGYKFGGKIIRPAQVRVAKKEKEQQNE